MTGKRQKCAVCYQLTNLFSYGVSSCNACTLFFRRVVSGKNPVVECKNQHLCRIFALRCRFCRFQQCLDAGMSHAPVSFSGNKTPEFRKILDHLECLDRFRRHRLLDFRIPGDIDYTVDQMAQGVVRLPGKPEGVSGNLTTCDWGFMCGFSTVEMMRKLEFTDLLGFPDLVNFLKHSHFPSGVFSNAWNSFIRKIDKMTLPDGSDPFPEASSGFFTPEFLNRIRFRLVGRIVELKVAREEFLLLTAILICNPAIPHLSDSARSLISSYQQMYSSALFQYCLINYQNAAPSRFNDILSLCTVINATLQDYYCHFQLFKLHEPKLKLRAIIEECLGAGVI